jgi:sulfatase maturation enzyme AslB (radical SAM superfamily)
MIFHKEGKTYDLGIKLANSINAWLKEQQHQLLVHIGSDGDPFASHVYRHFMEQTPGRENIKYSILTNGLMLKEFHTRVPNVIQNLKSLGISIDGASRYTYERLRLGGRWDKMVEALECASDLKKRHDFHLSLHMVVQQENWHEMGSVLELGHKHGVDRVYFNKIEDWDTNLDFSSQTFTELDEFKDCLWRVSTDPIAWNNVASLV